MPHKDAEKAREYLKAWKAAHPDEVKEYRRIWRSRNPGADNESCRRYRATPAGYFFQRIKRKGSPLTKAQFLNWHSAQKKECFYCGIPEERIRDFPDFVLCAKLGRLTVDRKEPKGRYTLDNIVLSCMRCNSIKSDFFSVEEMKIIGGRFVRPKWEGK